ncbi:hypothetical protein DMUE_3967 [Dictyocoela muelleri]|nr:hypothetical protein DMUE_3967 [Dictyocoela muelleri]
MRVYQNKSSVKLPNSNHEEKTSYDSESLKTSKPQYKRSRTAKMDCAVSEANRETEFLFWKGMKKTQCWMNQFILEGSAGFDKMSLREKMTVFIKESSDEIKKWFYLKGMSTELPPNGKISKKSYVIMFVEKA